MNRNDGRRTGEGPDAVDFVKGLLIGVAAALAVGGLVVLLTSRSRTRRDHMRPERRLENYSTQGEALGDIPSAIGEGGGSVIDTIRAVNQALDTGRQAMETLQEVMGNLRGN